jgi:muconolactone delta-isomerase
MRFMVIGSWDPTSPEIPELIAQEKARTDELIDEGVVQQLSLRADGAGGYMLVQAESAGAVREHLGTLPFMNAGIMQIEVVELRS